MSSTKSDKSSHERYLHKPFTGSSHSWALGKLDNISPEKRVLDVGSGQGAMGEALKARGFGAVTAVEIDPDTREHTKHLYSNMVSSLSELEGEKYDLVLLLDIIEHLPNPKAFLIELQEYCAPGAKILVSVPNIAYWAIRLMLLFGYFEYMERGPLDKTHLHFFTRRHLNSMLKEIPSFRILGWDSSIFSLELVLPDWFYKNSLFELANKLRLAFARILPGLGAYQLLVEVEVPKDR